MFRFNNYSFYNSIFKIGYSRFEIFLYELRQNEYLAKKSNSIMNKAVHQFENSPMCKFVHCTTMWKIMALPRGKAGTLWE